MKYIILGAALAWAMYMGLLLIMRYRPKGILPEKIEIK